MCAFLGTTFMIFENLPPPIQAMLRLSSVRRYAKAILAALLLPATKTFGLPIAELLHRDLEIIEGFCRANQIPLRDELNELRQLLDLVRSGNMVAVLEPSMRVELYPDLFIPTVITVLEKFRDFKVGKKKSGQQEVAEHVVRTLKASIAAAPATAPSRM
eukprot:c33642_g1_i1.p2 GENE.c33642_g1_i1~~c33642_g1_i1.p2  ORF type:complete len:177 (+),score=46.06 c33642_g1_i1:57-533(+)